jgi:hypothetical protein
MSFQICLECGTDFSGDDEDELCDECAVAEIDECEEETGHAETEIIDGDTVCKNCGVVV